MHRLCSPLRLKLFKVSNKIQDKNIKSMTTENRTAEGNEEHLSGVYVFSRIQLILSGMG